MDINQANILNDTTVRGSLRFGASRFIGTMRAIGPNMMFIKYDSYVHPEDLPGTVTPYQGGYIIDFGENWSGFLEDTFRNGNIITLILPPNTKEIEAGAFASLILPNDQKTTSITIPGSVEFIAESAFADCVIKKCTIEDGKASLIIESNAFEGIQLEELNILRGKNDVSITSEAFKDMKSPNEEEYIKVILPTPSTGKITIGSSAFLSAKANINVPSIYGTKSDVAKVNEDSFAEAYNVNYNGEDPAAPWGAKKLNGEEVNG